jgi:FkbM family methyltransferase
VNLANRFRGLQAVLYFDNWPWLMQARILDRKTGLVIYRKNGCEIVVDHGVDDASGTRACIVGDMYRKYLPFMKLAEPVSVLDLGANGGGFTLMLHLQGIKLGRTVCVEMNKTTFTRLALNLATNLDSAQAINAAVCDASHGPEIALNPSCGWTGGGIYNMRAEPGSPSVTVPTITLQDLYDRYFQGGPIGVCKIDIEKAEYEILESASEELLTQIDYLIIEFHDSTKTPAILKKLESLGFVAIEAGDRRTTEIGDEVWAFRGLAAQARSASH